MVEVKTSKSSSPREAGFEASQLSPQTVVQSEAHEPTLKPAQSLQDPGTTPVKSNPEPVVSKATTEPTQSSAAGAVEEVRQPAGQTAASSISPVDTAATTETSSSPVTFVNNEINFTDVENGSRQNVRPEQENDASRLEPVNDPVIAPVVTAYHEVPVTEIGTAHTGIDTQQPAAATEAPATPSNQMSSESRPIASEVGPDKIVFETEPAQTAQAPSAPDNARVQPEASQGKITSAGMGTETQVHAPAPAIEVTRSDPKVSTDEGRASPDPGAAGISEIMSSQGTAEPVEKTEPLSVAEPDPEIRDQNVNSTASAKKFVEVQPISTPVLETLQAETQVSGTPPEAVRPGASSEKFDHQADMSTTEIEAPQPSLDENSGAQAHSAFADNTRTSAEIGNVVAPASAVLGEPQTNLPDVSRAASKAETILFAVEDTAAGTDSPDVQGQPGVEEAQARTPASPAEGMQTTTTVVATETNAESAIEDVLSQPAVQTQAAQTEQVPPTSDNVHGQPEASQGKITSAGMGTETQVHAPAPAIEVTRSDPRVSTDEARTSADQFVASKSEIVPSQGTAEPVENTEPLSVAEPDPEIRDQNVNSTVSTEQFVDVQSVSTPVVETLQADIRPTEIEAPQPSLDENSGAQVHSVFTDNTRTSAEIGNVVAPASAVLEEPQTNLPEVSRAASTAETSQFAVEETNARTDSPDVQCQPGVEAAQTRTPDSPAEGMQPVATVGETLHTETQVVDAASDSNTAAGCPTRS